MSGPISKARKRQRGGETLLASIGSMQLDGMRRGLAILQSVVNEAVIRCVPPNQVSLTAHDRHYQCFFSWPLTQSSTPIPGVCASGVESCSVRCAVRAPVDLRHLGDILSTDGFAFDMDIIERRGKAATDKPMAVMRVNMHSKDGDQKQNTWELLSLGTPIFEADETFHDMAMSLTHKAGDVTMSLRRDRAARLTRSMDNLGVMCAWLELDTSTGPHGRAIMTSDLGPQNTWVAESNALLSRAKDSVRGLAFDRRAGAASVVRSRFSVPMLHAVFKSLPMSAHDTRKGLTHDGNIIRVVMSSGEPLRMHCSVAAIGTMSILMCPSIGDPTANNASIIDELSRARSVTTHTEDRQLGLIASRR